MNHLTREALKSLAEIQDFPCISLYMPIQKAGTEVRQNPIRFKNLIRKIEEDLENLGLESRDFMPILSKAQDLDSAEFWESQDSGLAIFMANDFFQYYSLPCDFPELALVGEHFHLSPLVQFVNQNHTFYILCLSQQGAQLLAATPYAVEEVEIEGLSKTLDEALLYDETAKDMQFRISTSKGGTNNAAQQAGTFHGQGSPDQDQHQEAILQYFHYLDGQLHEFLNGKTSPLVLTGVEYLFPLYREANTYQHLVEAGITGNTKISKPEELQVQAWEIVKPIFKQHEENAIARFQEVAGTTPEKASQDLKDIVKSAFYQRVEALFVPMGQQMWGKFDPENEAVDLHSDAETGDEDLIDFAATHTLINGGMVYALEPDQLPEQSAIAAIYRY